MLISRNKNDFSSNLVTRSQQSTGDGSEENLKKKSKPKKTKRDSESGKILNNLWYQIGCTVNHCSFFICLCRFKQRIWMTMSMMLPVAQVQIQLLAQYHHVKVCFSIYKKWQNCEKKIDFSIEAKYTKFKICISFFV